MRKLHLVGLTTDREGLIFSGRKGSKSGGFVVPVGKELLSVIAELQGGPNGEGPATDDTTTAIADTPATRAESSLTPREMQARLRAGQTIEEVAAEAGVGTEWVGRFAVPILAEQAKLVELALTLTYSKPRLGESSQPLAASVGWNLADRGIFLPEDRFDAGWSAFHLHDSVWIVRFRYHSRGRPQDAAWELDVPSGHLSARDRLASELGYIEKGRRRPVARSTVHEDNGADETPAEPRTRALKPARPTTRPKRGRAATTRRSVRPAKASTASKPARPPGPTTVKARSTVRAPARSARVIKAGGATASKRVAPKKAAVKKVASKRGPATPPAAKTTSGAARPARTRTARKPPAGRPAGRRTANRASAPGAKRQSPLPTPAASARPTVASRPRGARGALVPTAPLEDGSASVDASAPSGSGGTAASPAPNSAGVRHAVAKVRSDRLAATRSAPRWQAPAVAPAAPERPRSEERSATAQEDERRGAEPDGVEPSPGQGPAGDSGRENGLDAGPPTERVWAVSTEPVSVEGVARPVPAEWSGGDRSAPPLSPSPTGAGPNGDRADDDRADDDDGESTPQFAPPPPSDAGPAKVSGRPDGQNGDGGRHRRPTITAGRVGGGSFPSPQPESGAVSLGSIPTPLPDRPRRRLRIGRRRDG